MNMNAKAPLDKVTLEEVAAVCHDLLLKGERPSAARIQELLGKGSTIGIGKLLKSLQNQSAEEVPSQQQINLTPDTADAIATLETEAPIPPAVPEVVSHPVEVVPVIEVKATGNVSEPAAPQPKEFRIEPKRETVREAPHHTDVSISSIPEERLEELSDNELVVKIRRLESMLAKEQSRREAAEKMAEQAKDYADTIKGQVALRINDLRENMANMIEQLKAEAKIQKENANQDLLFYREQLKASNQKLIELTESQPL